VDVDDALVAVEVESPDPFEQLSAGEHAPRGSAQRAQEVELEGTE